MQRGVDRMSIVRFVGRRHSAVFSEQTPPQMARPQDVADEARRIAEQYYRGRPEADGYAEARKAEMAGWLVYSLRHYGLTYEQLCDVADDRVARVVVAITPDVRLPGSIRLDRFKSVLGAAGVVAHCVLLAELSVGRERLHHLSIARIYPHAPSVKQWLIDSRELLKSMTDSAVLCGCPELKERLLSEFSAFRTEATHLNRRLVEWRAKDRRDRQEEKARQRAEAEVATDAADTLEVENVFGAAALAADV